MKHRPDALGPALGLPAAESASGSAVTAAAGAEEEDNSIRAGSIRPSPGRAVKDEPAGSWASWIERRLAFLGRGLSSSQRPRLADSSARVVSFLSNKAPMNRSRCLYRSKETPMASSICEQRTQKQVKAPGLYQSKGISHTYVIPLREVERGKGGILETRDFNASGQTCGHH